MTLWSLVEALAWTLMDPFFWFRIDAPEKVLATLRMIGGAVFCILNVLEQHDLLCQESPVKNIALVLSVLYDNTRDWRKPNEEYDLNGDWDGSEDDEVKWRGAMMAEAIHHGIVFEDAPYKIKSWLEEDSISGRQNGKGYAKWKFNWAKQVSD